MKKQLFFILACGLLMLLTSGVNGQVVWYDFEADEAPPSNVINQGTGGNTFDGFIGGTHPDLDLDYSAAPIWGSQSAFLLAPTSASQSQIDTNWNGASNSSNAFSIVMFFRLGDTIDNTGDGRLFRTNVDSNFGWGIDLIGGADLDVRFRGYDAGLADSVSVGGLTNFDVFNNPIQMVGMSYDGVDTLHLRTYRTGALMNAQSFVLNGFATTNVDLLVLGGEVAPPHAPTMIFDDFATWQSVLTPAEFNTIAATGVAGIPEPNVFWVLGFLAASAGIFRRRSA